MAPDDGRFEHLRSSAMDDPAVVGLILAGSRGAGFHTPSSDVDVRVVLRDDASPADRRRYDARSGGAIDLRVMTGREFAAYAGWGGPFAWDRYSFAHAQVVIDKTGDIRRWVSEKGRIPEHHRDGAAAAWLDAYINATYRSLKCMVRGNRLGARLEAAEAIGWFLSLVFGLDGRHRPFSGYLEQELRAYPLASFPLAPDDVLGLIAAILDDADTAAQRRLLGIVDGLCRRAGHGDVIEGWGDDYPWILTGERPDAGARPSEERG